MADTGRVKLRGRIARARGSGRRPGPRANRRKCRARPARGAGDRQDVAPRVRRPSGDVTRGWSGLSGVESELELPFAALHQLCGTAARRGGDGARAPGTGPAGGPGPGGWAAAGPARRGTGRAQRARRSGDRDSPLVVLVDDAQWLDEADLPGTRTWSPGGWWRSRSCWCSASARPARNTCSRACRTSRSRASTGRRPRAADWLPRRGTSTSGCANGWSPRRGGNPLGCSSSWSAG